MTSGKYFYAANFDVTSDEEITLDGFLALHEMTAADEEDGEEELWQVMKALGYDRQLQLSQVMLSEFHLGFRFGGEGSL